MGTLLRKILFDALRFDAPATLPPQEQEALRKRLAPYRSAAKGTLICGVIYLFFLLLILGNHPQNTLSNHQLIARVVLSYTCGAGLLHYLRYRLQPKRNFADFHRTVAHLLGLGPRGLSLALLLLHAVMLVALLHTGGTPR